MKRLFISIFLILNMLHIASAQDLSHIPGAFLDIGFGARALGMGGAFVATSEDVHSIMWNPAGLARVPSWQTSFSFTKQLGIVPYSFLGSCGRIDHLWSHAQAIIISGDELMSENRLLFGGARSFYDLVPGLMVGTTLEFRQASFGKQGNPQLGDVKGDAYGFSWTWGVRYQYNRHLAVAVKFQDVLNMLHWTSSASGSYWEGTPLIILWGIAFQRYKGLTVELDWNQSFFRDRPQRILLGTEYEFFHYFDLRSGIAGNVSGPEANLQYAMGLGIKNVWKDHLKLDFAYLIHEIQNYYRISLLFMW